METQPSENRPIILIVEDDKDLNEINSRAMAMEGYDVKSAFSLREAEFLIEDADPDVILLDIKLGDGNGIDFCRKIRKKTAAHIIYLTSVTNSESELEGLVAGGDDFLRKPYKIELLLNRVRKALTKERKAPHFLSCGPFTLHLISAQVFANGEDLRLTQKEFAVFLLLSENERKVLSAEYIYETAWGPPRKLKEDKDVLKNIISRLRSKIEKFGYTISTYRAKGYALEKI